MLIRKIPKRLLNLFVAFVLICCLFLTVLSRFKPISRLEDAINASVYSSKVFCVINTIPKNHATRVKAVQDTWATHCDEHTFSTSFNTPPKAKRQKNAPTEPPFWVFNFGTAKIAHDSRTWLWDRLRATFRKIHQEKLNDFDWFLKADDDTFVIVENLRNFVQKFNPEKPYFVIQRHWLLETKRDPNQEYGSGGAGYVLSRGAVRKFIEVMTHPELCRNSTYYHEDTEIGECLKNAGVTFIDAVDDKNRHHMLPIGIENLITPDYKHKDVPWAVDTSMVYLEQGSNCCAPFLISTHYVQPPQMYSYYYFIYRFKLAIASKA